MSGSVFLTWAIFRPIVNVFMRFVMWVWFMLQMVIAEVLDLFTQLFFIFSGMTPVSSKTAFDTATGEAQKTDIVNFFLTKDVFRKAYVTLSVVALVLVVIFAIAKIIKQDYFEKAGPRSKGPIFRNVALSFIAFICIIPIFYFIIGAAGALALLVMKALGYDGGGIGTMLFNMSWSDGGKSFMTLGETMAGSDLRDDNFFGWYDSGTFYEYFWNESAGEMYILDANRAGGQRSAIYYWWIFLLTGLILISNLFKMLLAVVSRMFKLLSLFIIAPSPISQIVLDDGAKFKAWKDNVIQESLKVVGCVLGFMIFLLIAGAINDLDIARFAYSPEAASAKNLLESNAITAEVENELSVLYYGNATVPGKVDNIINSLSKALLLIAGVGAIQDMDTTITPLLSGGKSSMDIGETGKGLTNSMSTLAKGALDLGKAGVGLAVSAAGAAVSAAGGIASSIGQGAETIKGRALDAEAAKDKLAALDKAKDNTPKTPTPGGDNDPTDGGNKDEAVNATENNNTNENKPETPPQDNEDAVDANQTTPQQDDQGEDEGAVDANQSTQQQGDQEATNGDDKDGAKQETSTDPNKSKSLAEKMVAKEDEKAKEAKEKAKQKEKKKLEAQAYGTKRRRFKNAMTIGGMVMKPLATTAGKFGLKAGKMTAKAAGGALSSLLKATGLGGVASLGEHAVSNIKDLYDETKKEVGSVAKGIAGGFKKRSDMAKANKDKAREIVDNKPKATTTKPVTGNDVVSSTNQSLDSASEQREIATKIGNNSDEAQQLSMTGYDVAEQANNEFIAAEDRMMEYQDKYDEANAAVEDSLRICDVLESDDYAKYVKAHDEYQRVQNDSSVSGAKKKSAEKKYMAMVNDEQRYGEIKKVHASGMTIEKAEKQWKEKEKVKNTVSADLEKFTNIAIEKEDARDNILKNSSAAVRAKIGASTLDRMTRVQEKAKKSKNTSTRLEYATDQIKTAKAYTAKANSDLSGYTKTVTKQNDEIAKDYGYTSGSEMREQESYSVAGQTIDSAFTNLDAMRETYNTFVKNGGSSEDASQLNDKEYEEIKKEYGSMSGLNSKISKAQAEYNTAKESREQLEQKLNDLKSQKPNKRYAKKTKREIDAVSKQLKESQDKEIAAKNTYDSLAAKSNSAISYRFSIDEYSDKYQAYQGALATGNEAEIKRTRKEFYAARQNMEKEANQVQEIAVRVSFGNSASGANSRQKAPVTPTATVPTSGTPYRSNVGGSILKSLRDGRPKEVSVKIKTATDRGQISDSLANIASMLYADKGNADMNDIKSLSSMINSIPTKFNVDISNIKNKLEGVRTVPDKKYYRDNGINTVEKYSADNLSRYAAEEKVYKEAMESVRKNYEAYKQNNDIAALNAAKEALSQAITSSANMNDIRMEIENRT